MPENRRRQIQGAGLASTIGLVLVLSVVIGYALGAWLDTVLGTEPWLTVVLTLMGVTAGFIEVYRIAQKLSGEE